MSISSFESSPFEHIPLHERVSVTRDTEGNIQIDKLSPEAKKLSSSQRVLIGIVEGLISISLEHPTDSIYSDLGRLDDETAAIYYKLEQIQSLMTRDDLEERFVERHVHDFASEIVMNGISVQPLIKRLAHGISRDAISGLYGRVSRFTIQISELKPHELQLLGEIHNGLLPLRSGTGLLVPVNI